MTGDPDRDEPAASAPAAAPQPPATAPQPPPGAAEPLAAKPPEAPEPPDLWDRTAAWLAEHGPLPALGVLTLAMVVIYAHMFAGELAGDDLTFHMAESARIADCLRQGDFDLWNPSANGGFASAYYYQVIPQLASAVPAALFGHHLFFFELSVFLPLVLAPAAAYRGLRLMGATPWQAVVGALAVGFLNGESRWGTGNAGTFNVGLYTQTWALAAFPVALGHAVRWATEARGAAPAIAWGAFVTLCHPFAGVCLGVALVAGWGARPVVALAAEALAGIGRGMHGDPARGALSAVKARLGERWRAAPRPWLRPWLGELGRLAILGLCLFVAWMPIWLPLVIDYAGFGGFPHRVNDEIGPGFKTLLKWYAYGAILDFKRPVVLTWSLPLVALLARPRFLRWLWAPAILYAFWLGMGPHLGKTDDDLIPAVRFLGAMQVVIGLAIGAGALWLGEQLWDAPEGSALHGPVRWLLRELTPSRYAAWAREVPLQHAVRTGIAALAAALAVLVVFPGASALASRVHVLEDFEGSHGNELHDITLRLQREPPGRKQVGAGAENHWWNLLSYEYGRRPSLLMMGGGGLQASPNYDFLWSVKDFVKNAWVYDAPLLVFQKSSADGMPIGDTVLETRNYQVRRLPSPGLVSPVQVVGTLPPGRKPARAAALTWFRSDQPQKDLVLAYDGFGAPGGPPHGTVTRAFRQDSPGDAADIYAEVDVTGTTTFMARESWHPRWHAYIDRIDAPVRRVTPDFFAVDVPPGHHVIAFRFERPWWAHASWLAWPLVPLIAWPLTRRRRPVVS
ncbi:MAG TPA: hypothetical protein VFT22_40665 [Kofleriaceae bacterium]|nr:hypothetical protein [Kofleriaceae bacterium]